MLRQSILYELQVYTSLAARERSMQTSLLKSAFPCITCNARDIRRNWSAHYTKERRPPDVPPPPCRPNRSDGTCLKQRPPVRTRRTPSNSINCMHQVWLATCVILTTEFHYCTLYNIRLPFHVPALTAVIQIITCNMIADLIDLIANVFRTRVLLL